MPQRGTALAEHSPPPPSPQARFALRRLALNGFRNYASLRLDLDGRPVVLSGPNGAGKTNLLEAVSLLTPGRGLRNARLEELTPVSTPGTTPGTTPSGTWGIAASTLSPEGPVDLATGIAAGETRRQVRVNGKQARGQNALAPYCAAIWLTPQMDRLFLDGAEERRRFLDRLVFGFDPAHAGRTTAYQNTRRQRQRLLAEGTSDTGWLDALERTLAQRAVAIAAARLDLAQRLDATAAAAEAAEPDTPFPTPRIRVVGEVEEWLAQEPALAVEDRLAATWRRNRAHDAATGQTSLGPHRSDMAVHYAARNMPAAQCSTGEQKALLIGLTLAAARLIALERAAEPMVLLDEVSAHLDPTRRAALYERLLASGAQFWLTGTEPSLFAEFGETVQHFHVAQGHLTPATEERLHS